MGTTEANGSAVADAIVVGAGPAGAVTAMLLARAGIDTLLLDRERFPRPKPCGDCLSAAATDLLRRHGLLDSIRDAGAVTVHGWRIFTLDGTAAAAAFPGTRSLALERRLLDRILLDAAVSAGARFRRGHVVDLSTRDGRVRGVRVRTDHGLATMAARLVVGADGLRSVVARRLGRVRRPPRLRKVSLTAHLPVSGPRFGEMHLIPGGCVGYAPAGASRCNLTLVVETARAGDIRDCGPAAFFRRRVASAPALRPLLAGPLACTAELDDADLLASGPFDWPSRGPAAPGAALVGDAAGYYDPFTGQGIYRAMAGAELLVDAVGPVLRHAGSDPGGRAADVDAAVRRYAGRERRHRRSTRRFQWGVEQLLSRPRLAGPALRRLASAPSALERLIEVAGDLRPPRSLLSPAVVSSFLVPPAWRSA